MLHDWKLRDSTYEIRDTCFLSTPINSVSRGQPLISIVIPIPNAIAIRIPFVIPIRIPIESQSQSESQSNSKRIPIQIKLQSQSQTESHSNPNPNQNPNRLPNESQSQSIRNQIPIAKVSFRDSNHTNGIRSNRIFLGIESSNLPNPESPNTTTVTRWN